MTEASRWTQDPEAVSTALRTIRSLELSITSIDEIIELLTPMFQGHEVKAPRIHPGMRLFRSRICDKPNHIRELSYPPPHLTPLGRANRPGSPVLYCSTSRTAPFFESRPDIGDTAAIVRWNTTAPLMANHVGYTDAAFKALGSNREHAKWDPDFPKTTEGDVDQLVVEFLAEMFTRPVPPGSEYRYKVSVAIAEKLFLDNIFDGLLYPTVQMKANADNFALKPRYADTNLRFLKAEFVRIKAVRAFAFDLEPVSKRGLHQQRA